MIPAGILFNSRRNLTEAQCDDLWSRIQSKKRVYAFGRDFKSCARFDRMQERLMKIRSLGHLARRGIYVDDPMDGHLILLQQMFGGKRGNTEHTACL